MNLMAAGDGNRVWFPEMIEMLRSRWNAAMPFPLLIELCSTLDGMFQRRRSRGPTLPPGSRCPECGRIVGSENQQQRSISVRATILSLRRFRIASSDVTERTEKERARYRPRTDSIHMAAVALQLRKASARTRCADTKRQSDSAL